MALSDKGTDCGNESASTVVEVVDRAYLEKNVGRGRILFVV